MQLSQSVPAKVFRPTHMAQGAARVPQPAACDSVQPVCPESVELDRVVDLGYN
ncbi:hypothetical protein O4G98_17555 [Zoogloeaceae bacterium G21618-S1]|jgi:hypothetical protein|nr:hypothetical protein [Zoogloeaceae bacterium G21618-S1]